VYCVPTVETVGYVPENISFLKYLHQLLQMRDLIGGQPVMRYMVWVVIDGIHTCIDGPEYVYVYCIADHDGFFGSGFGEIEGKVEDVFVGLHAVAFLRGNEVREIAGYARVLQL